MISLVTVHDVNFRYSTKTIVRRTASINDSRRKTKLTEILNCMHLI